MAGHETLFSLEVAVECMRLQSSTVTCRLPAVAFRLLDFPTLLVHHVEPEDASKIKDTIFMDQELNGIPLQLQELKDHKGNFVVKKGKSCMFKMNLETLQAHLCSAPLYVMLVDTWPEVPKLVASCTVSLEGVIQSICNDVQKSGIEMPSVHGIRGSYKFCNLMGSEIGWIVLGLRLLSLGGSLMPHIPQAALVTRKSVGDDNIKSENIQAEHRPKSKTTDIVVEDLEVATTGPVQVNSKKLQPATTSATSCPETNLTKVQTPVKTSGTQTVHLKSKRQSSKHLEFPAQSRTNLPNTDMIISNTHCPPPLYFNADLPVNNVEIGRSHEMENKRQVPVDVDMEPVYEHEVNTSIVSSITSSEATSVSSREQYTETHYQYQSQAAGEQTTMSVRKTRRKQTSSHQVKSLSRIGGKPSGDSGQTHELIPSNFLNHSQMPILSALLQELSLLHGNVLPRHVSTVETDPQHQSIQRPSKQSMSLKGKENLLEADFSNPKQSPYRHKHEECTRTPRSVPPKKSWLRKEPIKVSKPKPKTKLRYGMTNTQKLRLQKNNPELLKHLEAQEAKVQSYRQSLTEKVQRKEKTVMKISEANEFDLDVSTEISHHIGHQKLETHVITAPQSKNSVDLQDDIHERSKKKRPIPSPRTPRATDGTTFKWSDVDRIQEEIRDHSAVHDELTEYIAEKNHQTQDEVSSSEKSVRSVDVYLPTPMMDESVQDNEEPQSLPVTPHKPIISIPGFPSMDSSAPQEDEDAEKASPSLYSANFDSSKNFESTGEQDLPRLSRSSSDRSEDPHLDLSKDSRSSRSVSSSDITKSSDAESAKPKETMDHPQPAGRHATGFALPKPLMSTKSPVPLAVRRSSRPSLHIQPPADIQEDRNETASPPTPKPRHHLQQTGSTMSSSSQHAENYSTSEFSSKDSEKDYKTRSRVSKKEYSTEGYSEDFSSSDSN
ncbi:uncharacterized protein [Amphiura filiformis]|uniref:uncharacterized protein n=1 Tax=Amphiura filiformis TaxID=82378 RepID=UPI003B20CA19